jgi:hypothetical protein
LAASDRETVSKRFFLRVNRAAAVALIHKYPEMRPVIRIATGVASLGLDRCAVVNHNR